MPKETLIKDLPTSQTLNPSEKSCARLHVIIVVLKGGDLANQQHVSLTFADQKNHGYWGRQCIKASSSLSFLGRQFFP